MSRDNLVYTFVRFKSPASFRQRSNSAMAIPDVLWATTRLLRSTSCRVGKDMGMMLKIDGHALRGHMNGRLAMPTGRLVAQLRRRLGGSSGLKLSQHDKPQY